MPPSPILGGFGVSRSPNQADNQAQNLFLEITETKDGKSPGYLQMAPGLELLLTLGSGPIRYGTAVLGGNLFQVSGSSLYQITQGLTANFVGSLLTSIGPVSMITNNTQIAVFDSLGGYLTTNALIAADGGFTLTGGTIPGGASGTLYVPGDTIVLAAENGTQDASAILTVTGTGDGFTGGAITDGGSGYVVDDDIVLQAVNGDQIMAATIQVMAVSGGVVTSFTIPPGGAGVFLASNLPSAFTQFSSSGAGTGFTVTALSYTQSGQVASFTVTAGGAFSTRPNTFTQSYTSGAGTGFTLIDPTYAPGNALLPIVLPFGGAPLSATYQDGYGLVSVFETQQFYQSDLNDLSTWEALNFSSADATPDYIVAMIDLQRQVFIFKQLHFEMWNDAGTTGFAFQRNPSVAGEVGCAATFSLAKANEMLIWLAQNDQGVRFVVMLKGYEPQKISTAALDWNLAQYSVVSDAIAYIYSQSGHEFYVLTFPSQDITWCYDLTASRLSGVPQWHNRPAWDENGFHRHWSNSYATFVNTTQPGLPNIVGDFRNGNLYALSLTQLTDNGTQRKWLRTWRALAQQPKTPQRYSCLTIEMETGIDVPAVPALPAATDNPQLSLRWSDDGGHNWSNAMFRAAGPLGQTSWRVLFYRLGSTRRATGLDRILELSSVDSFKIAITGAVVE